MKDISRGKFKEFAWTAPGQPLTEIVDHSFKNHPFFKQRGSASTSLQQFIENELGLSTAKMAEPESAKHIEYMRKHELVDYCETSEKGHMRWFPKGVLVQQLLLQYARDLANEWGAFEMVNPMLIRGDQNDVGELMGEFHERDYKVDGGRGIGFLRYASDPLMFPALQKVIFNESQTPLKVYEQAHCFRNEQDGEVSGLKRMRWFIMSDMHAACSSEEQALGEYETLTRRFGKLMDDVLDGNQWVLGWEITRESYKDKSKLIKKLSDEVGVPAFIKVMDGMSHYYAFKNEFQAITADGSNIQVSTVQWDVKNGPRFNIGYTGSDGEKHPCPVILHASSLGSVERTLCGILEGIAINEKQGIAPQFPLWLAPTQVRVVPVSDQYTDFARELSQYFNAEGVRCDYDDRNETVGKKIRNAGREWTPRVIVVGENELNSDTLTLPVNVRGSKERKYLSKEEVVRDIKDQTSGKPYLPLSLNPQVSQRPLFK
jgi:threonyl-tRNA synthetase